MPNPYLNSEKKLAMYYALLHGCLYPEGVMMHEGAKGGQYQPFKVLNSLARGTKKRARYLQYAQNRYTFILTDAGRKHAKTIPCSVSIGVLHCHACKHRLMSSKLKYDKMCLYICTLCNSFELWDVSEGEYTFAGYPKMGAG